MKNNLTGQFVREAKKQYREDRDPAEPLFQFKRCLAHFAVGNEEVEYTTRLAGDDTFFLPFNRGTENPPNPEGHATAYLWEDLWQKDTLLNLLQNYLCVQVEKEKTFDPGKGEIVTEEEEKLIFPRFHQLDVTRKLLGAAERDGAGHRYLVQHSAGSGKSNSIAWLAHGLRRLHPNGTDRLFDTIVVVTDRRVLDQQLQGTIKQFEQTAGTVVPITKTSRQLRGALEKGKDIVVTTIQKFPVISEAVSELDGQRFAVLVDEAHSGQTGEHATQLQKALSASLEDAEGEDDEGDFDLEDAVVSEIKARGKQDHISYFAFTATPKNKTLELFGYPTPEGEHVPFHVYSMRQAIVEGFILDVLKNYTTYKRYFKLAKSVEEDHEYDRRKATRALTSYVDLQPHAIEEKTQICLDHFLDVTADAIQGQGRAMLVTRSRLHCVRYYLAFKKAMQERGLPYEPLVAFSGTVKDPDTGIGYTEASLNDLGRRTKICDAFKLPSYRILIVANKFQTGFDCPPLHTMWVDKKLGGVSAVQTLSRLNRTMRGKTETVVLDFVNEAESIQTAFQPYYQTTSLVEDTDPNKLYDLAAEMAHLEVYTQKDVDDFAAVFFDEQEPGEKLQPILRRPLDRWRDKPKEEREDLRSLVQSFVRLYAYVSQLISFVDPDLEKLYVFARNLSRKLPRREGGGLPQKILDEVDLDSFRIQETYEGSLELESEDGEVHGIPTESGGVSEPEKDFLSNIVTALNDVHGLDLDERDRVRVEQIVEDVEQDESVQAVMSGPNSKSNKRHHVNSVIDKHVQAQVNDAVGLYQKLIDEENNKAFKRALFGQLLRQFAGGASEQKSDIDV